MFKFIEGKVRNWKVNEKYLNKFLISCDTSNEIHVFNALTSLDSGVWLHTRQEGKQLFFHEKNPMSC
jgi:hypothetical protein